MSHTGILGSGLRDGLSLKPVHYQWAYDLYEQAIANTWFPNEIQLDHDKDDWNQLSEEERHALSYIVTFLSPEKFLINDALAFAIYPYVSVAEVHMYLAKQLWEEANHAMALKKTREMFTMTDERMKAPKSLAGKKAFIKRYVDAATASSLDIKTIEDKQAFIRSLVATYSVLKGIWFMSSYMLALSFRQRNTLMNFSHMIDWMVRDEQLHAQFGKHLILAALEENEELQTSDFANEIRDMILEAVALEATYNRDLLPHGILGLNSDYIDQYIKYLADQRLEDLGLQTEYNVSNPMAWMMSQ
jgi:ribonucleoside-diphosphate reductase beta chain